MGKKKIAIFSTSWAAELLYQYITGLRDGLAEESCDIYVFLCHALHGNTEGYLHGELNIFELPDLRDFDAALVFANGIDYPEVIHKITKRCDDAGIPLIFTGRDDSVHYFVGCDNYIGAKELGEHLINEHNVKDIWFIAGSPENMDSNLRIQAIKDVMVSCGLELKKENILYSNWDPFMAMDFINDRLSRNEFLPDAIVCANDTLAMFICEEFRKKGISVPKDVIITGFDNEVNAQIYNPSISSVDQSFDKIGTKCSEILKKLFANENCGRTFAVPSIFSASESCGCYQARNINAVIREIGRRKFLDQINNTDFDLRLSVIERMVLQGKTYQDLSKNLIHEYSNHSGFEGKSFHILIDAQYEKTIRNSDLSLRKDGYPDTMNVVLSKDNGSISSFENFKTRDMVPSLNPTQTTENRFFIFQPLHEEENVFGYIVFCDDYQKIKEAPKLRKYVERMNLLLGKYYSGLRIATLNMRLLHMSETDALTHVKNRVCYEAKENELQHGIKSGFNIPFAMAVFDINNLKFVNDTYGHEMGDYYIVNSCQLICKSFKNSPVYRIGGDEFVVIMEGLDYDNRDENIILFKKKIEVIWESVDNPWERVSIACGLATFNPETDHDVTDVFKRADNLMYECKVDMKAKMQAKK